MPSATVAEIERVFREHHGRAVAVLVRRFGDIDVAEEAVADAFAVALARWPGDGVPPNPPGWIITTARHRAIDRLRREATRAERHTQALALDAGERAEEGPVVDDRSGWYAPRRRSATPGSRTACPWRPTSRRA